MSWAMASHEALKVHTQAAVTVAAREAWVSWLFRWKPGEATSEARLPPEPTSGSHHPSDYPGNADTQGLVPLLQSQLCLIPAVRPWGNSPSLLWACQMGTRSP